MDGGRFISYGQTGEDAVLLRVFGDRPTGCWIDVGANHPVLDSVTKNFYDMGWRGINIEPIVSLYEALRRERPEDVNILAAVAEAPGELTFFRNDTHLGLSTFDARWAEQYRERGDAIEPVPVRVTTLPAICEDHLAGRTIDFLKIDTEGHELTVIDGHDFERFPATVLLAESGYKRDEITKRLAAVGMRFTLFDGTNCWYVAENAPAEIADRLDHAADAVLDGFHPYVYVNELMKAQGEIHALNAEIAALRRRSLRANLGRVRRYARRLGGRASS